LERPIILVTGGLGGIGSYVAEQAFTELNASKVIIVDNYYNSSIYRVHEIRRSICLDEMYPSWKDVLCVEEIDIGNYDLLLQAFRKHKPLYVFHLASTLTLDSKKFPRDAVRTNIVGTQNVIECCKETGVAQLVVASSASVFGDPDEIPTDENHHYKNNKLLYGACKIANEVMLTSYAEEYSNFNFTATRFFNVYGPRASINNVYTQIVQKWIKSIRDGDPIIIYGDGNQTMDLIYATDAARSMILCIKNRVYRKNPMTFDGFFNIGTGRSISVMELKDILFCLMNKKVDIIIEEHDPNLVKKRQCNPALAKNLLSWEPLVSVEKGLKQCIMM